MRRGHERRGRGKRVHRGAPHQRPLATPRLSWPYRGRDTPVTWKSRGCEGLPRRSRHSEQRAPGRGLPGCGAGHQRERRGRADRRIPLSSGTPSCPEQDAARSQRQRRPESYGLFAAPGLDGGGSAVRTALRAALRDRYGIAAGGASGALQAHLGPHRTARRDDARRNPGTCGLLPHVRRPHARQPPRRGGREGCRCEGHVGRACGRGRAVVSGGGGPARWSPGQPARARRATPRAARCDRRSGESAVPPRRGPWPRSAGGPW